MLDEFVEKWQQYVGFPIFNGAEYFILRDLKPAGDSLFVIATFPRNGRDMDVLPHDAGMLKNMCSHWRIASANEVRKWMIPLANEMGRSDIADELENFCECERKEQEMSKKIVLVAFVVQDDKELSNEEWEHLFEYGYFQTGVHGSADSSPFWDKEQYSADNPMFTPHSVHVDDLYDLPKREES